MNEVLLDAAIDSVKVFVVSFIMFFIIALIYKYIIKILTKYIKIAPLLGSLVGIIPQCGISIASADLYLKNRITIGTLIAIFLACSDEAIFILASSNKRIMLIPLLLIKLLYGFLIGFLVDSFIRKSQKINNDFNFEHNDSKLNRLLLEPLKDSFKIFIYALVINIIFGVIIYYIGEDNLLAFLQSSYYFSPVIATLIGLIPNCASSILLSKLYIIGGLSFGGLLAGLSVNAGLGLIYLFKNKSKLKDTIFILGILVGSSILLGYIFIWI